MPNDALDKLREIAENLIKMAPHHVAQDLLRDTGLEIYTLLPALSRNLPWTKCKRLEVDPEGWRELV